MCKRIDSNCETEKNDKPNKWQWKIIAKICVNGPIRDFVLNGTKITRNTTNEPTTTEEWTKKKV